jgi:hypothetical protein
MTIESRSFETNSGPPASVMTAVVDDLVVNTSLSKDAFAFSFPENVQVVHPPVDGKSRVVLWGSNNQPLREIRTHADLAVAAEEPHDNLERLGRPGWFWTLLLSNAMVILFLALVLIWRRRRRMTSRERKAI